MRSDETTTTTTNDATGATHTEVVREREVGTSAGGGSMSTAIVAIFAIVALALGAWFVVNTMGDGASDDGGASVPEVNLDVTDSSGDEG